MIEVRESGPEDVIYADAASRLIDSVADEYDIARRTPGWLASKIKKRHAALAVEHGELVGFGYWSAWEHDSFVSHSGLVVRPDRMGRGLGGRLKDVLYHSTRRQLPEATMMSLSTSPQVMKINQSLGFEVVPLDRLTSDPAFWAGCATCRNFADVRARGEKCCCQGLILTPERARKHVRENS
jgi:GNAT superfamily N-acetyltransferase